MAYLRLYHVQTGNLEIPRSPELPELQSNEIRGFGFSPDARFIWFTGNLGSSPNLIAIRSANRQIAFGADSTGPVKWLPDNRIGIVTESGFEFRDENGALLQRLPGPFDSTNTPKEVVTDWALSPDGNWIYSAEQSGIIRRWRAR